MHAHDPSAIPVLFTQKPNRVRKSCDNVDVTIFIMKSAVCNTPMSLQWIINIILCSLKPSLSFTHSLTHSLCICALRICVSGNACCNNNSNNNNNITTHWFDLANHVPNAQFAQEVVVLMLRKSCAGKISKIKVLCVGCCDAARTGEFCSDAIRNDGHFSLLLFPFIRDK